MDNTVVINDYRQMDKVIKEGRQYLLNMCKKIKKANCNVLLIQKSILRDAVDDVSLGLREGEILALLGPNGAGKTTAINMIRGDLTPTEGNVYLEGVDVHRNTRLAQQCLGGKLSGILPSRYPLFKSRNYKKLTFIRSMPTIRRP